MAVGGAVINSGLDASLSTIAATVHHLHVLRCAARPTELRGNRPVGSEWDPDPCLVPLARMQRARKSWPWRHARQAPHSCCTTGTGLHRYNRATNVKPPPGTRAWGLCNALGGWKRLCLGRGQARMEGILVAVAEAGKPPASDGSRLRCRQSDTGPGWHLALLSLRNLQTAHCRPGSHRSAQLKEPIVCAQRWLYRGTLEVAAIRR